MRKFGANFFSRREDSFFSLRAIELGLVACCHALSWSWFGARVAFMPFVGRDLSLSDESIFNSHPSRTNAYHNLDDHRIAGGRSAPE